ncbi:MAG: AraC family transcriptional regulator [Treponema sp.]|jgi:YesN/AraC family two-component response regulator|nr:AraC family transcriptional regulator [Treponema sp.]
MRYIAKHYTERILVTDMAKMLGLTPSYFGLLFKQETGMTMNQYITRTRIRNAEHLLRSGQYQVRDITRICGFSDNVHFYKQFKALMGIAPSQFIPKRSS